MVIMPSFNLTSQDDLIETTQTVEDAPNPVPNPAATNINSSFSGHTGGLITLLSHNPNMNGTVPAHFHLFDPHRNRAVITYSHRFETTIGLVNVSIPRSYDLLEPVSLRFHFIHPISDNTNLEEFLGGCFSGIEFGWNHTESIIKICRELLLNLTPQITMIDPQTVELDIPWKRLDLHPVMFLGNSNVNFSTTLFPLEMNAVNQLELVYHGIYLESRERSAIAQGQIVLQPHPNTSKAISKPKQLMLGRIYPGEVLTESPTKLGFEMKLAAHPSKGLLITSNHPLPTIQQLLLLANGYIILEIPDPTFWTRMTEQLGPNLWYIPFNPTVMFDDLNFEGYINFPRTENNNLRIQFESPPSGHVMVFGVGYQQWRCYYGTTLSTHGPLPSVNIPETPEFSFPAAENSVQKVTKTTAKELLKQLSADDLLELIGQKFELEL